MGSGTSRNVTPLDGPKKKLAGPASASETGASTDGRMENARKSPAIHPGTNSQPDVRTKVPEKHKPVTIEVAERLPDNTELPKNSTGGDKTLIMAVQYSNRNDIRHLRSKLEAIEMERNELKVRREELEQQMSDLESHNLDLAERVQMLEEQLETENQAALITKETPCVNTVEAKDQCIAKLEKESAAVHEEIMKLKAKYKKKIKQMSSQLMEARQASSVATFETRGELQRLKQENADLIRKSRAISIREEGDYADAPVVSSTDRKGLILDLSSQISEQEKTIMSLESTIQDRDKMINELIQAESHPSSKVKRGRPKLNARLDSHLGVPKAESDGWLVDALDARSVSPLLAKNKNSLRSGQSQDLHELTNLVRDMQLEQSQRTKTKKKSLLRNRGQRNTLPQKGANAAALPHSRESSGTSRDSGMVSNDSDHLQATGYQGMSQFPMKNGLDSLKTAQEEEEGELEWQIPAAPSCSSSSNVRQEHAVSPDSLISPWSDEEQVDGAAPPQVVGKTDISLCSIRRISAPRKKKKHALYDHDRLVQTLMNDLDQDEQCEAMGIKKREGVHAFTRGPSLDDN